MSSTRSFLFATLAFVAFLLWQAWEQDYGAKPATTPVATTSTSTPTPATPTSAEVPQASGNTAQPVPAVAPAVTNSPAAAQRVEVRTDLLRLSIDTRGGAIVQADLLNYPVDPSAKDKPVRLL